MNKLMKVWPSVIWLRVPLGRRKAKAASWEQKSILTLLMKKQKVLNFVLTEKFLDIFLLNDLDLKLFSWMSDYYHYSMGQLILIVFQSL